MKAMMCAMIVLALPACAVTNTVPTPAEQDRMLMEAVALKQRSRYSEAEALLTRLLELQPERPDLKKLLAETQALRKADEQDPVKLMHARLQKTVLPEVNLRDAAVRDVIEFLQREAQQRWPDKSPVNFVWLVPAEAELPPVTLTMREAPLGDVIKYVTQLAGLRYRVDAHAVVIYKPEPNVKPQ